MGGEQYVEQPRRQCTREPGTTSKYPHFRRGFRRRWGCDVLLQKALRRKTDDRVLIVQHLGPPHLCQGEAHRHPRHLVLRPLQDEKYKKEEQKLEREQKRGRITASSARRL